MTIENDFSKTEDQSRNPVPTGRVLALDLGKKRVGVAVSDELQMTARGVSVLTRETAERLLAAVKIRIEEFDAAAVVIGLPLNFDGSESRGAAEAREIADFFSQNLTIPVFLQDERLTSRAAEENLREQGVRDPRKIKQLVDMEAAAIILRDFLSRRE